MTVIRGREDKRRAVLAGALTVFARDGYARASIDAIAATAAVSTRTIYNHFGDKAHLFESVLEQSTTEVADVQVAIIDKYLRKVTDLEADLVEFGRELATPITGYAEHFALARQIQADIEHVPAAALEAWQAAGPRRVIGELAHRMQQLAERGLLRADDPETAASHFMLLVQGAVPFHHGVDADRPDEITAFVTAGVRAFLYGYGR